MEIYNITRQVELAQEVEIAFSFWRRLRGLLGRRLLPNGSGLLLKPCKSIHSCFMAFPFDAVFMNEEMVIVYLIKAMPPFCFSPVIREALSVLELPAGVIQRTGSRVGDELTLRTCFS